MIKNYPGSIVENPNIRMIWNSRETMDISLLWWERYIKINDQRFHLRMTSLFGLLGKTKSIRR